MLTFLKEIVVYLLWNGGTGERGLGQSAEYRYKKAPPFNAGLQSLLGIGCPDEEESTVLVKKAMPNDKIPIPK